jgi:hypothetical protein
MSKTITNPVKVIRAKCLDCCCGSFEEVKHCAVPGCEIYPFRFGKNPYHGTDEIQKAQHKAAGLPTNPVKAIRAKCLECSAGSANEVRICDRGACALHPFRSGKNPYRKEMSEEQKIIRGLRLKNVRDGVEPPTG